MTPTPAQVTARAVRGRRSAARMASLGRAHRKRPADTLPRLIPLYLAQQSADQLPSLVKQLDPRTMQVLRLLDPFTREPVA